jgi:hypothetical protein
MSNIILALAMVMPFTADKGTHPLKYRVIDGEPFVLIACPSCHGWGVIQEAVIGYDAPGKWRACDCPTCKTKGLVWMLLPAYRGAKPTPRSKALEYLKQQRKALEAMREEFP